MTIKSQLIEQAGFSRTFEVDRLDRLIDLAVAQCITAVQDSPRDHCFTTYDLDYRDATVQRCIQSIKQRFQSD